LKVPPPNFVVKDIESMFATHDPHITVQGMQQNSQSQSGPQGMSMPRSCQSFDVLLVVADRHTWARAGLLDLQWLGRQGWSIVFVLAHGGEYTRLIEGLLLVVSTVSMVAKLYGEADFGMVC
jgi:hypothetical protein